MMEKSFSTHLEIAERKAAIIREYARWAPTYNRLFHEGDPNNYSAAEMVATIAAESKADKKINRILDLATGTGAVLKTLSPVFKNASLTGLDISEPMMQQARDAGLDGQLLLCDIEAMRWPVIDKSVDLVTCAGALSMVKDLDHVLKETDRTLKQDGVAVMSFLINTIQAKGIWMYAAGQFPTIKRTPAMMEEAVRNAGFTPLKPIQDFIGYSGPQFQETHGVIAFTR